MQVESVKLKFNSPLHSGEAGIGIEEASEFVHSDTLFAGLCNAWVKVHGKNSLKKLLGAFPTCDSPNLIPPFIISSAFLFYKDTLFFPKPALRPPRFDEEVRIRYGQEVKKVEFIPKEIFESWIGGEEIEFEKLKEVKDIYEKSISFFTTPKVQIDRIYAKSNPYYCGEVWFDQEAGLYFLIQINNEEFRPLLTQALNLLGEEGLGGERSSGYGQFKVIEWRKKIEIKTPEKSNSYLVLSLFYPDKDTIKPIDKASYNLIERKGWIFSASIKKQTRRKIVRMFTEGSVFMNKPAGYLVDLTPTGWNEHSIFRYGLAFSIPVWREENE